MHYLAADQALRFSPDLPSAAAPAPAFVLLPDLSDRLWHGQSGPFKEDVPTAFFKLVGCR
jgi:hypothetical protein